MSKRILVVEDQEDLRASMRNFRFAAGYEPLLLPGARISD